MGLSKACLAYLYANYGQGRECRKSTDATELIAVRNGYE